MSVINTNIPSLNAQRNLMNSAVDLNTSIQRLSSGMRINSAKDDAAGLSIATRMDSQIRGSTVAMRNANDAISFSQTGEGALGNMTSSLQRMRDLSVQSANDTNTTADRANIQTEFLQLQSEVTRLQGTKFNGQAALGSGSHVYQVGADTSDTITVATNALTNTSTSAGATIDVTTAAKATAAITAIDLALTEVQSERANYGAVQNRFASVVSNLGTVIENQSASKSRIMDTDFAAETAKLSRGQILQQAGTAMLSQANSLPQGVLALLR